MANTFVIPKWLDYDDFNNYPSEGSPTTNADFINYETNQNKLVGAIVNSCLWQPKTNYNANQIINTPNMPAGMEAVVLSAGITSGNEPAWGEGTTIYQDGSVKWKLRYKDCLKNCKDVGFKRTRSGKPTYGL